MKFWLSAFVMLFAAVELFDWIVQAGGWHASGVWLVLGGMGLAAVSNVGNRGIGESEVGNGKREIGLGEGDKKNLDLNQAKGEEVKGTDVEGTDRSDDSISFKVRPLKR